MTHAVLLLNGKEYELPTTVGTENELAIDISQLRTLTGAITLDSGYANTGSVKRPSGVQLFVVPVGHGPSRRFQP